MSANKLMLQHNRLVFLEGIAKEVDDGAVATYNRSVAKTTLFMVKSNWSKFEIDHDKLLSTARPELDLKADYFKNNAYQHAATLFVKSESALQERIFELEASLTARGEDLANLSTLEASQNRPQLPKIDLPKFSGNYSEWRHFHDMFVALVGSNTFISKVEKMQYLHTHLVGDAAQLISNLPIAGDFFAAAWDTITARYDNERLLISSHLDRLLFIPTAESRSAKALNHLLNVTAECTNALAALGSPIHSEPLVVRLLTHKLDRQTREAWELHLGSTTAFPTLEQFKSFITGMARALECIEMEFSPIKPSSTANKSHSASQRPPSTFSKPANASKGASAARVHLLCPIESATADTSSRSIPARISDLTPRSGSAPCSYCNQKHFIAHCAAFHDLSPQQRYDFAIKEWLCFNCLGAHNVNKCRVPTTCKFCTDKPMYHHSLIHGSSYAPLQTTTGATPRPLLTSSESTQRAEPSV